MNTNNRLNLKSRSTALASQNSDSDSDSDYQDSDSGSDSGSESEGVVNTYQNSDSDSDSEDEGATTYNNSDSDSGTSDSENESEDTSKEYTYKCSAKGCGDNFSVTEKYLGRSPLCSNCRCQIVQFDLCRFYVLGKCNKRNCGKKHQPISSFKSSIDFNHLLNQTSEENVPQFTEDNVETVLTDFKRSGKAHNLAYSLELFAKLCKFCKQSETNIDSDSDCDESVFDPLTNPPIARSFLGHLFSVEGIVLIAVNTIIRYISEKSVFNNHFIPSLNDFQELVNTVMHVNQKLTSTVIASHKNGTSFDEYVSMQALTARKYEKSPRGSKVNPPNGMKSTKSGEYYKAHVVREGLHSCDVVLVHSVERRNNIIVYGDDGSNITKDFKVGDLIEIHLRNNDIPSSISDAHNKREVKKYFMDHVAPAINSKGDAKSKTYDETPNSVEEFEEFEEFKVPKQDNPKETSEKVEKTIPSSRQSGNNGRVRIGYGHFNASDLHSTGNFFPDGDQATRIVFGVPTYKNGLRTDQYEWTTREGRISLSELLNLMNLPPRNERWNTIWKDSNKNLLSWMPFWMIDLSREICTSSSLCYKCEKALKNRLVNNDYKSCRNRTKHGMCSCGVHSAGFITGQVKYISCDDFNENDIRTSFENQESQRQKYMDCMEALKAHNMGMNAVVNSKNSNLQGDEEDQKKMSSEILNRMKAENLENRTKLGNIWRKIAKAIISDDSSVSDVIKYCDRYLETRHEKYLGFICTRYIKDLGQFEEDHKYAIIKKFLFNRELKKKKDNSVTASGVLSEEELHRVVDQLLTSRIPWKVIKTFPQNAFNGTPETEYGESSAIKYFQQRLVERQQYLATTGITIDPRMTEMYKFIRDSLDKRTDEFTECLSIREGNNGTAFKKILNSFESAGLELPPSLKIRQCIEKWFVENVRSPHNLHNRNNSKDSDKDAIWYLVRGLGKKFIVGDKLESNLRNSRGAFEDFEENVIVNEKFTIKFYRDKSRCAGAHYLAQSNEDAYYDRYHELKYKFKSDKKIFRSHKWIENKLVRKICWHVLNSLPSEWSEFVKFNEQYAETVRQNIKIALANIFVLLSNVKEHLDLQSRELISMWTVEKLTENHWCYTFKHVTNLLSIFSNIIGSLPNSVDDSDVKETIDTCRNDFKAVHVVFSDFHTKSACYLMICKQVWNKIKFGVISKTRDFIKWIEEQNNIRIQRENRRLLNKYKVNILPKPPTHWLAYDQWNLNTMIIGKLVKKELFLKFISSNVQRILNGKTPEDVPFITKSMKNKLVFTHAILIKNIAEECTCLTVYGDKTKRQVGCVKKNDQSGSDIEEFEDSTRKYSFIEENIIYRMEQTVTNVFWKSRHSFKSFLTWKILEEYLQGVIKLINEKYESVEKFSTNGTIPLPVRKALMTHLCSLLEKKDNALNYFFLKKSGLSTIESNKVRNLSSNLFEKVRRVSLSLDLEVVYVAKLRKQLTTLQTERKRLKKDLKVSKSDMKKAAKDKEALRKQKEEKKRELDDVEYGKWKDKNDISRKYKDLNKLIKGFGEMITSLKSKIDTIEKSIDKLGGKIEQGEKGTDDHYYDSKNAFSVLTTNDDVEEVEKAHENADKKAAKRAAKKAAKKANVKEATGKVEEFEESEETSEATFVLPQFNPNGIFEEENAVRAEMHKQRIDSIFLRIVISARASSRGQDDTVREFKTMRVSGFDSLESAKKFNKLLNSSGRAGKCFNEKSILTDELGSLSKDSERYKSILNNIIFLESYGRFAIDFPFILNDKQKKKKVKLKSLWEQFKIKLYNVCTNRDIILQVVNTGDNLENAQIFSRKTEEEQMAFFREHKAKREKYAKSRSRGFNTLMIKVKKTTGRRVGNAKHRRRYDGSNKMNTGMFSHMLDSSKRDRDRTFSRKQKKGGDTEAKKDDDEIKVLALYEFTIISHEGGFEREDAMDLRGSLDQGLGLEMIELGKGEYVLESGKSQKDAFVQKLFKIKKYCVSEEIELNVDCSPEIQNAIEEFEEEIRDAEEASRVAEESRRAAKKERENAEKEEQFALVTEFMKTA